MAARLAWRQVTIIRALGKYLRQAGFTYSDAYVGEVYSDNPEISRLLVDYFFAKFDPKAVWFDDLEPLDGMSLPWSEKGLPQPCIDEPCQVDWMDKVAELNAA